MQRTHLVWMSPVIEEEGGSSLVEPAVIATSSEKRLAKRSLPNKDDDDACNSLFKKETIRAEVEIHLAEEQITLTQLQQTKARLEIHLLKAQLQNADLSTNKEL